MTFAAGQIQRTNKMSLPTINRLGQGSSELATLAAEFNAAHQACVDAANSSFKHALIAGDKLLKAKALCAHGDWTAWLAANFQGSKRTAQLYMRVFVNRHEIQSKSAGVPALLTLESAIGLIADKRPERPIDDEPPAPETLKWPDDVSFLPAELDADHAFRCTIQRLDRGGAFIEIFPSAKHPGYLFVHAVEFVSPDPKWAAEEWWTKRPMRWSDDAEGRRTIAFFVPEHLRDEAKAAGWQSFPSAAYEPVLPQMFASSAEAAA
jgi:hypothetical protein